MRDLQRLRLATRSPGRVLQCSLVLCLAVHGSVDAHAAVEIHAVDTDRRIVLNAQIDVLRDAEAKVARLAEVALPQLVLLDLEAALEDLLCLGAADGDVDGDLLVAADTEGSDGVACFAYQPKSSAYPASTSQCGPVLCDGVGRYAL